MGELITQLSKNTVMRKFSRKETFNIEWQQKRAQIAKQSQAKANSNDWVSEFINGKNINEYGINFTKCGLCALGQQENCMGLIKQMCKYDYLMASNMGAKLTRTQTLADGNEYCDFWYEKK